jgi:hypothetical protein
MKAPANEPSDRGDLHLWSAVAKLLSHPRPDVLLGVKDTPRFDMVVTLNIEEDERIAWN